jgi:uncharacterized Zn finger protein
MFDQWAPYVPVAERRKKAAAEMAKLAKKGHPVSPVVITGRAIATTVWGKAWCTNLEAYSDYANRLPRGRTYARNGSVVDLQIAPGKIDAHVSGSMLYRIAITVTPLAKPAWEKLCGECAGGIDSLVELLQGRFAAGVMERLCHQQDGLFPTPKQIKLRCSCPDGAYLCKHVAAVLYGIGARLDHQPELLFTLRQVAATDLLAKAGTGLATQASTPTSERTLPADDVGALFGLEMDQHAVTPPEPVSRSKTSAAHVAKTAAKKAVKKSVKKMVKPVASIPMVSAPGERRVITPAKKPTPQKKPHRRDAH